LDIKFEYRETCPCYGGRALFVVREKKPELKKPEMAETIPTKACAV
jgi:hypothetical protein